MKTFTVKGLFNNAWQDYKRYWKIILLIGATFALLQGFAMGGASYGAYHMMNFGGGMNSLLVSLASVWLGIGYITFLLNIVDGKQAEYKDIFYGVKSAEQFAYYLLVGLAYGVAVMLGMVLLIVPGIIIMIGWMFAKYYIAENRLGFSNAFLSSWEITKGHRWHIFWLIIVLVLFNLLGALALGIGLIITIPVSQLVIARLFRTLENIPLPDGGTEGEE